MPKMQTDYFTPHLGLISDYLAEIFHSELRQRNYTDSYDRYFGLGSHVEERDRKAIARTTSGLVKLIHPDGQCTKEEVQEYLTFATEMRRRVKEQLKRLGGVEYSRVNLSFLDKQTGRETFVSCRELGSTQLIPETSLNPGDLFTVGFDSEDARYSLYRLQVTATPSGHRFNVVGASGKGTRESARMAYDFIKANASRIGLDRDIAGYDINMQIMSLMQGKDSPDLGVAMFIAMVSALVGRSIAPGLVVLGQMSIHGVLNRVEGLADRLRISLDAGAKRILIPTESRRDFAELPAELIDKLQIDFYSDPAKAAFKAFAEI
jgi:ATP-dependent Lon protease